MGFALAMVYCGLSVCASVYNELLMKTEPSLHLSNIQLYTFGIGVNVVGLLYQVGGSGDFWRGWELPTTWLYVACNASVGLLISRVMKHFDSIIKIFCVACSNLVVYISLVLLFDQPFAWQFVLAFALVTGSGYKYATSPAA